MITLSNDRFAGVLAGVFLMRAAQSLVTVLTPLVLPVGEFSGRFLFAVPALVGVAASVAIGYGFLRRERRAWFYAATLVVLGVAIALDLLSSVLPFLPGTGAPVGLGTVYGSMVATGIMRMILSGLLLAAVVWLMRREMKPQGVPPTL